MMKHLMLIVGMLVCCAGILHGASAEDFEVREYQDQPYRLFVPANYDPQQSYPIVLFLHGLGEKGTDNESQLNSNFPWRWLSVTNQQLFPAFFIAPQSASGWWGESQIERVANCINALKNEFNLDPERIYVTGLSSGGMGTFNAMCWYPDLFAAAVPACGRCDELAANPALLRDKGIWLFHCEDDPTVSVGYSDAIVNSLRHYGSHPIYSRFPTGGHSGGWREAYSDPNVFPWLMAQRFSVKNPDTGTSPFCVIQSPSQSPRIGTSSATVSLTGVSSPASADRTTESVTCVTDMASKAFSGTEAWSGSITLPRGEHTVEVITQDNHYTTYSDTVNVVVETDFNDSGLWVQAGPARTVFSLTSSASLKGYALKDGDAVSSAATYTWEKVSGPGNVTFTKPAKAETAVTVSAYGDYVLRLTATDGALSASDMVSVKVHNSPQPGDVVAAVNAGSVSSHVTADGIEYVAEGDVSLEGWTRQYTTGNKITDTDEDRLYQNSSYNYSTFGYKLPVANGTYNVTLSFAEIVGNFNVVGKRRFNIALEGNTVASDVDVYSLAGALYKPVSLVFPVTVTDGTLNVSLLSGSSSTPIISAILVTASDSIQPPVNQAPTVSVSSDKTVVQLPLNSVTLTAAVTDDGLPEDPGAVSVTWSLLQGPDSITVSDIAAPSTQVTFSTAGTYVLQAQANDGELTTNDTVEITVLAEDDPGPSSDALIAINCGGDEYQATDGSDFVSDIYYSTSASASHTRDIAGTEDAALYQSYRYGAFIYDIPLENGVYKVELHFAETAAQVVEGGRIFDVSAEGDLVLDDLDVYAEVGTHTACVKEVLVEVADGSLTLEFSKVVGNAMASAIVVKSAVPNNVPVIESVWADPALISLPGGSTLLQVLAADDDEDTLSYLWSKKSGPGTVAFDTPAQEQTNATFSTAGDYVLEVSVSDGKDTVTEEVIVTVESSGASSQVITAINCGDDDYTATDGTAYLSDQLYSAGATVAHTREIEATEDDAIYQSYRYGGFSYNIPIENGTYSVVLQFAETSPSAVVGSRVFDVKAEGALVIDDLDVFESAGSHTPLDMPVEVTVEDGELTLEFVKQVGNAMISGIRIETISDE